MPAKRKNSAQTLWSIPDYLMQCVCELCPDGKFMCRSICYGFDPFDCGFGLVILRKLYWYSHFCNHLTSTCHHQNSCVCKACYNVGKRKKSDNGELQLKQKITTSICTKKFIMKSNQRKNYKWHQM